MDSQYVASRLVIGILRFLAVAYGLLILAGLTTFEESWPWIVPFPLAYLIDRWDRHRAEEHVLDVFGPQQESFRDEAARGPPMSRPDCLIDLSAFKSEGNDERESFYAKGETDAF